MVGSKPLYVAVAQRKEDRRAILQVISQMLLFDQLFFYCLSILTIKLLPVSLFFNLAF